MIKAGYPATANDLTPDEWIDLVKADSLIRQMENRQRLIDLAIILREK